MRSAFNSELIREIDDISNYNPILNSIGPIQNGSGSPAVPTSSCSDPLLISILRLSNRRDYCSQGRKWYKSATKSATEQLQQRNQVKQYLRSNYSVSRRERKLLLRKVCILLLDIHSLARILRLKHRSRTNRRINPKITGNRNRSLSMTGS